MARVCSFWPFVADVRLLRGTGELHGDRGLPALDRWVFC